MPSPVVFEGVHATFVITRPAAHVVLMTISGRDAGEHGDAPMQALEKELAVGPFALFIDARRTSGASIDVSNVWARWLRTHRDSLHRIHMLTGTKFVQLTADFVRRFSKLGDSMLVYTDGSFDDALTTAARS